ncbi:MAG: GDSL-type esterase/lipase family protein [Janthinobacterium lividum]
MNNRFSRARRFLSPFLFMFAMSTLPVIDAAAQPDAKPAEKWATAWAASVQGPYPSGNPSAQPDMRFAFPSPEAGAHDQTFRLVVRPDIWGRQARLRFSNALGTRPVTFDGVFAGLQRGSAAVIAGTNQAVTFGGQRGITIAPGEMAWSDPVVLPFAQDPASQALAGRRLAVSFHVVGESGPMTWHAKALNTSYVSRPGAGSLGQSEDEAGFPFTTASWYFLDAVDMRAPADTHVIVAFGDSITDGTASTMNGDDRWPDVLARRLHALRGGRVSVVNAGIGGNQVAGPEVYTPQKPFPGGPSAQMRLARDVIGLSGVSSVIWLEGINDFSKNGNASVDAVQAGMKDGASRLRAALPGVRVIGATLTSAFGSTSAAHGSVEQDDRRKALNAFIRNSGVFDGVADFDAATLDAATGGLRAELVPESTTGGPGDKLHPNRTGYLAMGNAIDLRLFEAPSPKAQ